LEENQNILPEKLQNILPRIISENWLENYQEIYSIERFLNR
jgi:acyl carrier protein phosphodiesterase